MKKILALLSVLLCVAPSAKAAILWVHNLTGRPINVAVKGALRANNSLNSKTIKPGKRVAFGSALFRAIGGPLMFAFTDEMEKKKYAFYETYSRRKSPKKTLETFPMAHFDIRAVQITMKRGQPAIRQSYPKMVWLIGKQPWKGFIKKYVDTNAEW